MLLCAPTANIVSMSLPIELPRLPFILARTLLLYKDEIHALRPIPSQARRIP